MPVMMAAVRAVEIALGALPEDSLRLASVPVAFVLHALAGVGLALPGLARLLQVESIAAGLLDAARGVFGLAVIGLLMLGAAAARAHDMLRHRAWMIRAEAICMGSGSVAPVMFPVSLISRDPPTGLTTDTRSTKA